MNQTAIFAPFLAMILLTFAVWVFMFAKRIPFLTSEEMKGVDLTIPGKLAEISPASVSSPSDNLKNLFELPVLFYALVLYLFAVGEVDGIYVGAAWVFVVARVFHSVVHCTFNHVMIRFNCYLVGALALWFMMARAIIGQFTG